MLKLVPFNEAWITHEKLDIRGIYRRPRWTKDQFDQDVQQRGPDGLPLWDLTGALPIKQHNKWRAKGFEFVTLADRESLFAAYQKKTLMLPDGMTLRDFDQHQTGGPWNYKMYAAGQSQQDNATLLKMRADVQEFGSAAYEKIRRGVDPTFTLPKELQGIAPGGALPPLVPTAASKPTKSPKTAAPAAPAAKPTRVRRKGVSAAGKTAKKEPPKQPEGAAQ